MSSVSYNEELQIFNKIHPVQLALGLRKLKWTSYGFRGEKTLPKKDAFISVFGFN